MSDQCANCGKPVLDSDTVCWHCGYKLQAVAAPEPVAAPDGASRPAAEAKDDTTYDFRALIIYGVLTLVVIGGLWAVMSALSQRPILVRTADRSLGNDWLAVSDSELIYTISLPAGWQWLDVPSRDLRDALNNLIVRQGYIDNALNPLGAAVDDLQIVAVGLDAPTLDYPDPVAFVVIGRSEALGDLTPEAAIVRLNEAAGTVVEPLPNMHIPGQPQARFTLLDEDAGYQCRQLAVQDEIAATYLVAACSPQLGYGLLQRDFERIIDSFQFLEN